LDWTDAKERVPINHGWGCNGRPSIPLRRTRGEGAITVSNNPTNTPNDGDDVGVVIQEKTRTKKPSMYKVLMLNDDYTPMEFVVHVLEAFFSMSRDQATSVMLHVHRRGVGLCGTFTYEVAETKVNQVMDFARKHQHPLQCIMEKD